jgi:hypothetical protein
MISRTSLRLFSPKIVLQLIGFATTKPNEVLPVILNGSRDFKTFQVLSITKTKKGFCGLDTFIKGNGLGNIRSGAQFHTFFLLIGINGRRINNDRETVKAGIFFNSIKRFCSIHYRHI